MRPRATDPRAAVGEPLEERVLRLGVERSRRLVEDQQQRLVAHEAAGERELLPLAEATPRRRRPTTVRAGWRARRAARRRRRGAGPVDGGVDRRAVADASQLAEPDRLLRGQLEADEVLEGTGQAFAPDRHREGRQVGAVHLDPPRVRVVEPGEQLDERRLAGAVLAHDRDHRAGRQVQRHVVEHRPVGAGIGEASRGPAGCRFAVFRAVRRPTARRQRPHSPRATSAAGRCPARSCAGSRAHPRRRRRTARAGCRQPGRAPPRPVRRRAPSWSRTTAPT